MQPTSRTASAPDATAHRSLRRARPTIASEVPVRVPATKSLRRLEEHRSRRSSARRAVPRCAARAPRSGLGHDHRDRRPRSRRRIDLRLQLDRRARRRRDRRARGTTAASRGPTRRARRSRTRSRGCSASRAASRPTDVARCDRHARARPSSSAARAERARDGRLIAARRRSRATSSCRRVAVAILFAIVRAAVARRARAALRHPRERSGPPARRRAARRPDPRRRARATTSRASSTAIVRCAATASSASAPASGRSRRSRSIRSSCATSRTSPPRASPIQYLTVRTSIATSTSCISPRALIAKALRFLASPREDEPVRIVVRGRTGSVATRCSPRSPRAPGRVARRDRSRDRTARARPCSPPALEAVLRRALLRGLVPCIDGLELIGADDPDTRDPGSAPCCAIIPARSRCGCRPTRRSRSTRATCCSTSRRATSASAPSRGRVALERHPIDLSDPSELAARYRVGPGIIERVCAEVARRPDRADATPPRGSRELDDAVRQHLENRLGKTATRVDAGSRAGPTSCCPRTSSTRCSSSPRAFATARPCSSSGASIASITTVARHHRAVPGPPGTGKTMVAGVIARELGLELYRVDLSRIISKWIGETEKNLGALFDAAEDGQVMLLFDEADSLFAKRTEVKIERRSLREPGGQLPPAAARHVRGHRDPDHQLRQRDRSGVQAPPHVPRDVPVPRRGDARAAVAVADPAAGADRRARSTSRRSSQRFQLSGGYIRNAALRAAFLAAEEGGALDARAPRARDPHGVPRDRQARRDRHARIVSAGADLRNRHIRRATRMY